MTIQKGNCLDFRTACTTRDYITGGNRCCWTRAAVPERMRVDARASSRFAMWYDMVG